MATLKGNLRSPVTISNMGLPEHLGRTGALWTLQTLELFEVDENAQEKLSDLLGFNLMKYSLKKLPRKMRSLKSLNQL